MSSTDTCAPRSLPNSGTCDPEIDGAEPNAKVDTGAEYSSAGGRYTMKVMTPESRGHPKGALAVWGLELTDFALR